MASASGIARARWIYRIAAIYGIAVLAPLYFAEPILAKAGNPVTHPEMFYGFIGSALVFQLVYWTIGGDPVRYRPLMPLSWLAKLSFAIPCAILFANGRLGPLPFALSQIDTLLTILFYGAWHGIRPA